MTACLDNLDLTRAVLIDGKSLPGGAGVFTVEDPATVEVVAEVSNGDAADAAAAVGAAHAAFRAWRSTSACARSEILDRSFRLILRDRDRLAGIIVRENGKSRADALGEVTYAAEFFRWYAEEAVRSCGEYGPTPGGWGSHRRDPPSGGRRSPGDAMELPG